MKSLIKLKSLKSCHKECRINFRLKSSAYIDRYGLESRGSETIVVGEGEERYFYIFFLLIHVSVSLDLHLDL